MGILKITITSFRNHSYKEVDFSDGLTVIWGDNGSGKTSLLEAIHVLSFGKSFKTHKPGSLVKNGDNSFLISGNFQLNKLKETINTECKKTGAQKTKINGKPIRGRKDLIGRNPVVVLSPEEQDITKGGPLERRRFFDRLFSVVSKKYLDTIQTYGRLLKQRNASLVRNRDGLTQISDVFCWDEQLCGVAIELWSQRNSLMNDFKDSLCQVVKSYNDSAEVAIFYPDQNTSLKEYKDTLLSTQQKDLSWGRTTTGPHRDNIDILWSGEKIRVVGSQGEHKLCLVFLKIAEMQFIKDKTNKFPTLLLDDLFAKLDLGRSKKLVSLLNELKSKSGETVQTIVTTTDMVNIENSGIFSSGSKIKKHHLTR